MKRAFALALSVMVLTAIGRAEPRWCSIVDKDPSNKVFYPPIARAARVPGVVLARIIYLPNNKVEKVETISGPPIIANGLKLQLMGWTIRTDAKGDGLCESLVIAKFTITAGEPKEANVTLRQSIVQLDAEGSPPVLDTAISDPAPLRGWKLMRACIRGALYKIFLHGNHDG